MRRRWLVLVLLAACSRKQVPAPVPAPSSSALSIPTTAEAMTCRDGELGVAEPGGFGEGGLGLSGLGDAGREASVVVPAPVFAGRRPVVVQGAPTPSPASGVRAGALAVGVCAAFGAVRACYDEARKASPELEGTLDVELVIAPTGKVSAIARKATQLMAVELEGCVLEALRAQVFAREAAGTATYALRFRAPRGPGAAH